MRARPREINIFNMSLLDILCGALGAFCFMMLVALPYYVVGKVDQAQSQKRTEELLHDVEKLRERMSDPQQAEELRKLIDELEAQIKQLQGQLNQYAYENDQLKTENTRLTNEKQTLMADNQRLQEENQHAKTQLAMRKPFVLMAGAGDMTQDLAIFLEDVKVSGITDPAKLANAHFEPRTIGQGSGWDNDLTNFFVKQRGITLWVSSTTAPQSTARVFIKYLRPPPEQRLPFDRSNLRPTSVALTFYGNFDPDKTHFTTQLTPERFWSLAGTLNIDDHGKIAFTEATEAERDEAWRTIMKSEVPTPAPTTSPESRLDPADMARIRKVAEEQRRRLEEERARRQSEPNVSPTPTASANETPSEEESRLRRERALRELQSRPPSPSPATAASPHP